MINIYALGLITFGKSDLRLSLMLDVSKNTEALGKPA